MLHVRLDIIGPDEREYLDQRRGETHMKKLMTLLLGLSLAFGAVATVFAQDTPPKKSKKVNKTKGGRKKAETPKKDGGK